MLSFAGWLPFDATWHGHKLVIEWCFLGERSMKEPFFFESVEVVKCDSGNIRTTPAMSFDEFGAIVSSFDAIPPTCLLFHMSRCGSTLVSRMLSQAAKNVVVSEPDVINAILMAPPDIPSSIVDNWLKLMVSALGQKRSSSQNSLYLKLSSWNTIHVDRFRRIFPDVPLAFLVRNPAEVLASLLRSPPGWGQPDVLCRLVRPEKLALSGEYSNSNMYLKIIKLYLIYMKKFKEISLIMNYKDMPDSVWRQLLPFCKQMVLNSDVIAMQETSKYYSKDLVFGLIFDNNRSATQLSLVEMDVAMLEAEIMPLFRCLTES